MHKLQQSLDTWAAGAGKRQRMSPQDNAFHFFNRDNTDRDPPRKPHLEEAAMALLLLDVHSAPPKVGACSACSASAVSRSRADGAARMCCRATKESAATDVNVSQCCQGEASQLSPSSRVH